MKLCFRDKIPILLRSAEYELGPIRVDLQMKNCLFVVLLMSMLRAHSAFALDHRDTAHLLGRTGYGMDSSTWSNYKNLSRNEAVDYLLARQKSEATTTDPSFVKSDVYQKLFSRELSEVQKKELRTNNVNKHRRELAFWWWTEMLTTESTLNERMVLFWHGHFTSDVRKTHSPFIFKQNQIFRKNALGDYRVLLREVIKGPAMQLYLDNVKNRKGKPNENLARELLELFTLGIGNYTETDVREVARALTGWKISKDRKAMLFRAKHHDSGSKTVLGKTGHWGIQDVLDILLESPRTFEFLTQKLWREFVSPNPDEAEVTRLTKLFRESNYSIAELVKGLLKSEGFWAEKNRMTLVKSPVELAVGAVRDYSIPFNKLSQIINKVKASGQHLFYPPDVKGWRGHNAWLTSDAIVQRQDLLENLLRRKKREYKQNAKKLDLKDARIFHNDFQHFDGLMQSGIDAQVANPFKQLEKVLMNDFYQFK